MGYIKNSLQKFKTDALSKAIYDIAKYLVVAVVGIIVASHIPAKFAIKPFFKAYYSFQLYIVLIYSLLLILASFFILRFIYLSKYKALEKENFTDEITGLKNHKALKAHLKKLINELTETSKISTISIIVLDIDDFKEFNTRYGHTQADKILTSLGQLLQNDKRGTDDTFRFFKGDEYVVIAKNTCLSDAIKAADRKRQMIAENTFQIEDLSINLSVSCGVTEYKKGLDTVDSFLNRASKALSLAKEIKGKNSTKSNY